MSRVFISKNGVNLLSWTSRSLSLERKISSKEFSGKYAQRIYNLSAPFHEYKFFTYVNASMEVLEDGVLDHGGKQAPIFTVIPYSSGATPQVTVIMDNRYGSTRESLLCFYRTPVATDARVSSGMYFNMYNEDGSLFYTYNTPPLLITDVITVSDEWANSWVPTRDNPQGSPGRYIWGDFSNKMVMLQVMGVEKSTGFPALLSTPRLANNHLTADGVFSNYTVDSAPGYTSWSNQVILARRI